jgi:hypothetical protein
MKQSSKGADKGADDDESYPMHAPGIPGPGVAETMEETRLRNRLVRKRSKRRSPRSEESMKARATVIGLAAASLVAASPAAARTYLDSGGAGARTHLDSGGAGGRTHLDSGGSGARTHLDSTGSGAVNGAKSQSGLQWSDAGIGAGVTGGVILLLAGTSILIRPYRRTGTVVS